MKAKANRWWIGAIIFIMVIAIVIAVVMIHCTQNKLIVSNPAFGGSESGDWEGDRIYLGKYEQDGDLENGTEPILWRVLQVKETKALLLCEYALDVRPYNELSENVTWEDSDIRKWLNSDFMDKIFKEDETWKTRVLEVECANNDNVRYGTEAGKNTKDKVFLLSCEECANEAYGFTKTDYYGPMESLTRVCYESDDFNSHTEIFGKTDLYGNKIKVNKARAVEWWLRDDGFNQTHTLDVNIYGDAVRHEQAKCTQKRYLRPVIEIDRRNVYFADEGNEYLNIKIRN